MRTDPHSLKRAAATTLAVFFAACAGSTTTPEPAGPSQAVRVGEEVHPVDNGFFFVSLLAVEADSRCPSTLVCVWAGDVTARFGYRFGRGPTVPVRLHLNTPPRDTLVGGFRIVFDSLTPYPAVAGPLLPQDQYRAWVTLRTTR